MEFHLSPFLSRKPSLQLYPPPHKVARSSYRLNLLFNTRRGPPLSPPQGPSKFCPTLVSIHFHPISPSITLLFHHTCCPFTYKSISLRNLPLFLEPSTPYPRAFTLAHFLTGLEASFTGARLTSSSRNAAAKS